MAAYRGPIVDAHHHLWDLRMDRHPWLRPDAAHALGDLGPLRRDYLVADYLADAAGQGVVATVHVEAGWDPADPVAETRWLETLDKGAGVAARYVAGASLGAASAAAVIEHHRAASDRVVGIRDILTWHPDPGRTFVARPDLMENPVWRQGLAAVAAAGLVFDLMISPWQHEMAARLAADFPNQIFALNHCGSPMDRDSGGMARWRQGLRTLGRLPNIWLKVSDLVAYDQRWTPDSLRAVTLHCIDCFGTSRSLFASDAPVAGLHSPFAAIWDNFRAITADFPETEQRALFHDNAARLYGLPAPLL